MVVRVIEYRLKAVPGAETIYRLITKHNVIIYCA